MWERTLQDLIRGLRAHRNSSKVELDAFLEDALTEIRKELKGKDMELKAEGVVKMCYLMMLYPLAPPPSFAFHVVEVMSSPRYHMKQLGYIAAPMAFSSDTEEVVLTVNGIRKDLLAPYSHLPPLALMGLSDIVTPSLARDVYTDVASLTTHSKASVRKRAVLALFRIFEQYPDALRTGFTRLKDRLEDDDPGVVSATINVITELSRKSNPTNYLPLVPQLFEILTTSTNNWMLIKIIKLFATLTPLEPRLVRKLLPPITNLISTTPAISLLYECVRTCIVGGMLDGQTEAGDALARVCVEKLSAFLSDEDQNLKYIALLAMVKIVPTHPHLVADYQEDILKSLDDDDVSIRMRALELMSNMVSRRNIQDIVGQLLSQLAPPSTTTSNLPTALSSLNKNAEGHIPHVDGLGHAAVISPAYRHEVVHRILELTSTDTYANISDFEWYFSVLMDLVYVANVPVGKEIQTRMLDVVARVKSIRPYAVGMCRKLIGDIAFVGNLQDPSNCPEVVFAAAWICGEYARDPIWNPEIIKSLLQPELLRSDPSTVAVCVMAAAKGFGYWSAAISDDWTALNEIKCRDLVALVLEAFDNLSASTELVVQDRASNMAQLFTLIQSDLGQHQEKHPGRELDTTSDTDHDPTRQLSPAVDYPKSLYLLLPLFTAYDMNPVGYKAQERVNIPEGLDLDAPIVEPSLLPAFPDEVSDSDDVIPTDTSGDRENMNALQAAIRADRQGKPKGRRVNAEGEPETKEERAARRAARRARRSGNLEPDVDDIPVIKLDLEVEAGDSNNGRPLLSSQRKNGVRSKKREGSPPAPEIDRMGEMPEGSIQDPQAASSSAKRKTVKGGLKAVEIAASSAGSSTHDSTPRPTYDDYVVDAKDDPVEPPLAQAVPSAENAVEVQVVSKKKKKKKVKGDA